MSKTSIECKHHPDHAKGVIHQMPEKMKEENLFAGPGIIRTVSGIYVNVLDPDPDTIIIEDIAHALSMMPRWGGHCAYFFSVAQHSSNCAWVLPEKFKCPANQLAALMHDASEAFLMDIPRPIKTELTNYCEIEDRLMKVIASKFGFAYPLLPEIKAVDDKMLHEEWEHLIIKRDYKNIMDYCRKPAVAKSIFLSDFKKYTAQ